MAGHANSLRAILLALGANFAIFLAKLAAALLTGSGAMAAEAVHSLADCGNQCLLLLGMRQARRPPSPEHPLGEGNALYFWSFLVAMLLFSVGGMFSIYEGLHKLREPEPLRWPWLAVGVLAFGVVAEGFSMWGCLREVNKARAGMGLWRWFRTSRASELLVIFGEDLAALLGLTFALAAIVVTIFTGNPLWDACGSLAIGVLLVVVAVLVAVEVKALLVGSSAEPALRAEILAFIEAQPEVAQVYHLITLQLGPDIMLATKARMRASDAGGSAVELIDAVNRVESALRGKFSAVRWSFFEPDVKD
ncbi:MAG: cation diffusion facilitator family transporter [Proteobacteria bacterium]|nr:cation diffusion facilitator family transporter [Pseudomonadota bacterium]